MHFRILEEMALGMNDRYMEGNFHNSIRKERCSYWLLCLVIIALGIRIIGIRARDLYCDEAAMMLYAKMPWRGLVEILPRENYGPLYFIVQKSWNGLMEGYVWARLLSVTCGIVLVIALFGIGYHMQNRKLGWLAGLIAATNCFLVAFSQKIWSYIPCATFVTLTAWLAMQLIVNANLFEDAHPPSYNLKLIVLTAGCWLTATVAFYMHYIALPVLIGIALAVAWELWRVKAILRIWLLTQLAFLCSIAPWLKVLSMRAIAIAHGFHMKHTSISGVLDMFHDFSLFAPSIHHAILSARIVTAIGILAFGYLLIRGTLIAWHNLRYRFALSVFALGLLLWCIIAIFMPVWHPRALLPLAPFYLLIIAIGIMAHSHWRLYTWATLLIALQIASLSFYFGNDAYAEAQWRLAARYLQGHRSSNEPILHTSVLS
ncbi:MAG TPA: hypothetical protein EYP10_14980, partial [Armatimonadetes bacterium]|nr:hypothetical protein [Armatimonadota bacterium]